MNDNYPRETSGRNRMLLGALLVLLGIVFFLDQLYPINLGQRGWPLFIIVPGLFICAFAVALRGASGEALFIVGSIVTTVGLLLFYQNETNHWESWAYAWALVAPTAVGVGQLMYGMLVGRPAAVRSGTRVAVIGLVMFLLFGAFFESVIGIGGSRSSVLPTYVFPVLLIGLGALLLLGNLRPRRERELPPSEPQGKRYDTTSTDDTTVGIEPVRTEEEPR